MSEIIARWDVTESPLISSLKLLYSLNILSADELVKLSDVLGTDYQQIVSSKFVEVFTVFGDIRAYTPIIIVATSKNFNYLMTVINAKKISCKIFDGSFDNEVTLMTPAQFLNAIANLKVPFKKFTLVPANSTNDLDRYLYAVLHYSYYYNITANYAPMNSNVPSAWLAHYLKMQSRYVSIPEELQKYSDDTEWWKYPWIKSNSNAVDISKLRDVSIRYGIPLQLLKSVSRDRNYAEKMLKLNNYSGEIIAKVLAELFPG